MNTGRRAIVAGTIVLAVAGCGTHRQVRPGAYGCREVASQGLVASGWTPGGHTTGVTLLGSGAAYVVVLRNGEIPCVLDATSPSDRLDEWFPLVEFGGNVTEATIPVRR